ncbi:hypothetical protein F6476_29210 [Pseudomonas umsongensis]|uniref:hypothetical protein n=1 Tax=Pseudomonas umsongensis TaxID=198618 RepID=UPI0012440A53|nr:hypothetical protein [Pseudomonas umsongensis]QFG32960.1 hypothetical protein F6476_29210 [Pseudomonas umsongensis]
MNLLRRMKWRRKVLAIAVAALLTMAVMRALSDDPEIALVIGEPWEAMRLRSSAAIDPAFSGYSWFNTPKSDARLRFIDDQFGFLTPLARFFTVSFDRDGLVRSLRMSPQIEPLLLDDTLKVVLDLQAQWRHGGWIPIRVGDDPPFADTPEWRARLRDVNKGGTSTWQAGNQYQVMLGVNRFRDDKRPTEERYLIKLQVARPWVNP